MKFLFSLLLLTTLSLNAQGRRDIYPDPSQAKTDLAAALKAAPPDHKRILLDFGGNWCGDCQVLDLYLHNDQNRELLEKNFILIHVNVGHFDANLDLAAKYKIPLERGVPAMAVLDEGGKLLYSQRSGEFESMRRVDPSAVNTFLAQWKPTRAGCSVIMVNC
jgi:thiol:disulfide interchange protein